MKKFNVHYWSEIAGNWQYLYTVKAENEKAACKIAAFVSGSNFKYNAYPHIDNFAVVA